MGGRYEIREQIGKGGGGLVFHGYDTFLKRDVAIKRVLTTDKASEEEVRVAGRNLLGEAQTMSTLNHPNIVTVFDVGVDEKGGFVVMELLDGETLYETVGRGLLTREDFLEMAIQTLEALIAAHAVNVIHRDLKPTNVMVIWHPSGRFHTKVLDFGLAKFSKKPTVQTLNQDGTVMGSILFMAPEQFERRKLDERTDLYSMGCVYYHSLCGQYPYDGETSADVMKAHLEHRVTPLDVLRPDLGTAICQWVMWMINRDIENRPDSAKAALDLLPRYPDVLKEQELRNMPIEKTSKVKLMTIKPVAEPVQGANVPRDLGAGSSLNTTRLAGGLDTTELMGKLDLRERLYARQRRESGVKVAKIIIAASALVVGNFIALKLVDHFRDKRLNEIASEKVVVADPENVKLLTGFLFSKKSSFRQRQVAVETLERISGDGVGSILLENIKRAPTANMRLRLCHIMARREQEEAVDDLLEAFNLATSRAERQKILKLARTLVEDAKRRAGGRNLKGVPIDKKEQIAVMEIFLERISSLEGEL